MNNKITPYKGMNLDLDEKYVPEDKSAFIKDIYFAYDIQNGGGQGSFVNNEGNVLYYGDLILPEGSNKTVGGKFLEATNMAYVFCWNEYKNHFIYRINANTGVCEMVLVDPLLDFQYNPKYFINRLRIAFQVICVGGETKTHMVFTDNYGYLGYLVVEDIMKTNGFKTPFFGNYNRESFFRLGVPTPMRCIEITELDDTNIYDTNSISKSTWEFRLKHINQWEQGSEHGLISQMHVPSGNCSQDAKCLKLKIDAGSPLISKIQIEFRKCFGKARNLTTSTDWFLYDTIDKYTGDVSWYNKIIKNPWQEEVDRLVALGDSIPIAEGKANVLKLTKYIANDNSFEYVFCGNKQCQPLPVEETNRSFNYLPITAGNVFNIFKNIGTANHKRGFKKIGQDEIKKVSFSIKNPQEQENCLELRKVTIYGKIHNLYHREDVILRKKGGRVVFGIADCANNNPFPYKQVLAEDSEGIVGYLAGTSHTSTSKQYQDKSGTLEYVGPLEYSKTPTSDFFQKWEFNVPKGRYVFRLASHEAKASDDGFRNTSTYFAGQQNGSSIDAKTEIVIDTTNGDVVIKNNHVVIYDLTRLGKGCLLADATSVVAGYLYEDEKNKKPISKAQIIPSVSSATISNGTDHNGFFWGVTRLGGFYISLQGRKNCAIQILGQTKPTANSPFERHFVKQDIYVFKGTDEYKVGDRVTIKGRIIKCNTNIGVAGVVVVLTNGGVGMTDTSGFFRIVSHETLARTENVIITQSGCVPLSCGTGCTPIANIPVVFPTACDNSAREVDLGSVQAKLVGSTKKGLAMGGKYNLGFKVHDWLGRHTHIQRNESFIAEMPSFQETGINDFSEIQFIIGDINLPKWARKLTFFISDNLNYSDSIEWIVDRFQLVDNTGELNNLKPTQIRIYYESLMEYNVQNNNSTTTAWQFMSDDGQSVKGDIVEFIVNGDGIKFPKKITSLIKYNKLGKYFQIDYIDELKNLKENAKYKIIRKSDCTTKPLYYELCDPIDVSFDENGKTVLSKNHGTFNHFDTYLYGREIPVPIAKKTKLDDKNNIIETDENLNEVRVFPFLFEHHSPSDSWGDHCRPKGRVNVVNIYENEICNKTEVAVGGVVSNDGYNNNLHLFSDSDNTIFDENEFGGITGVIPQLNFFLIICEHDNFLTSYNDDILRVDNKGQIKASGTRFGRPERKIGSNYGCLQEDINTIQVLDGVVAFLDASKSALILHNFQQARDCSENQFKIWLTEKIRQKGNRYFHGGVDTLKKEYLFSSTELVETSRSESEFVNKEFFKNPLLNETIGIDFLSGNLNQFHSYVPEYYLQINVGYYSEQLISLINAVPYMHNNTPSPRGRYYGQQCKPYVAGIFNIDSTKIKKFLSTEVYSNVKMFCPYVITETGQISRIQKEWFEPRETFFAAPFLCDINTLDNSNIPFLDSETKILDGNYLVGVWIKALYTLPDENAGEMLKLTAISINAIPSEKSSNT